MEMKPIGASNPDAPIALIPSDSRGLEAYLASMKTIAVKLCT
jgi:hypothetical protein